MPGTAIPTGLHPRGAFGQITCQLWTWASAVRSICL
jgi:hypothetical protein